MTKPSLTFQSMLLVLGLTLGTGAFADSPTRALRACIKTNPLIVQAILAGDDPPNRPQAGSYTDNAFIFLEQFSHSF